MGDDFYSNGLARNREAMDTFIDQAFGAGLIERRNTVDECFVTP